MADRDIPTQDPGTGGGGGGSTVKIIHGSFWHDLLFGTIGNDKILGLDGDDKLHGGAGGDILDGGSGWDTATYWQATQGISIYLSRMSANTGDAAGDVYYSIEAIDGSMFADTIEGDAANNTFWGDAGNDLLVGMGGYDRLCGGDGNDKLVGGTDADYLHGGTGIDTVSYWYAQSAVHVYLDGKKQNIGEAAGDTIVEVEVIDGSRFNDILSGDANANIFWGDAGDDKLAGREGFDTLSGGDGRDSFVFDAPVSNANVDTITDFKVGTDTIVLSKYVFDNIREHELGIADSNLIIGAAATSLSHKLIYNAKTGDLFYDRDGVGLGFSQCKIAVLDKNLALGAESFSMAWI